MRSPISDVVSLAACTLSSRTRHGSYKWQLLIGYIPETRASLRYICLNGDEVTHSLRDPRSHHLNTTNVTDCKTHAVSFLLVSTQER